MDIKWMKDNRPKLSKETATVNGQVFPVVLEKDKEDGHDRPRFQQNRIVRDTLTSASRGQKLDLGDIWGRAGQGAYSKEEMLEFYRLIGYSMSGYAEIFEHEHLSCSVWCNECGAYDWVHPIGRCKKFVKEA